MLRKLIFTLAGIFVFGISPLASAAFGGVVFDPRNYRQNLISAVRSVQQVNNQLRQIEHEIRILANQATDLQPLSFSAAGAIDQKLIQIEALIASANSIALSVREMEDSYRASFPEDYTTLSSNASIQQARAQWKMTRIAYKDALLVQAKIVNLVAADREVLQRLLVESQNSIGNLQVAQAGNQLVALQTKQLMQHQLLMASHYRAQDLDRARINDAKAQATARFSAFIGSGTAYRATKK